jgi:hypothetical protein
MVKSHELNEHADSTVEQIVKHGDPNSKLMAENSRQSLKAKAVELGK